MSRSHRLSKLLHGVILVVGVLVMLEGYYQFRESTNRAPEQDIRAYRLQLALEDTARFVDQNMAEVQSLRSREAVLEAAVNAVSIDGLYCEFGVFSGSTINFIAARTDSTVHGFDSFEGLPENWRDGFPAGTFEMNGLPRVADNVELHKGWFSDSLPVFAKNHPGPAAFLHFDADLYSSTKDIFDSLGDRIVPGTVMVFDEFFAYPGWRDGEFKAFMEFVEEYQVEFEYLTYNRHHEQVALKIVSVGDDEESGGSS